jgi:hypothetical protein
VITRDDARALLRKLDPEARVDTSLEPHPTAAPRSSCSRSWELRSASTATASSAMPSTGTAS